MYPRALTPPEIRKHFEAGTKLITPAVTRNPSLAEKERFFETSIRPILSDRCAACHSGDDDSESALSVQSRGDLTTGGIHGPAIVPFRAEDSLLIAASWPAKTQVSLEQADLSVVIDLISEIRAIRSEMNVPLNAKPILEVKGATPQQSALVSQMQTAVLRLARLEAVNFDTAGGFAKGTARTSLAGMDIGLSLAGILDFEAERLRLSKEIKACNAEAGKLRGKLSNEGFLAKAPPTVIDDNKRRLSEEEVRLKGLKAALGRLDADV